MGDNWRRQPCLKRALGSCQTSALTAFSTPAPAGPLYLGLTGAWLDTADAIYAGFGTHHVVRQASGPAGRPDQCRLCGDRFVAVDAVLEQYSPPAGD